MTSLEFYEKMLQIREDYKGDEEVCHCRMDDLMCEALNDLGYEAGVRVFETTEKWYS